jgi:hypothetical protein
MPKDGANKPPNPVSTESGQAECWLDQLNPSETATVQCGHQALARLSSQHTWSEWMQVGEALQIGRTAAMRAANTNEEGPAYRKHFGQWLKHHGFDEIDKADRSRLLKCLANREAIEAWLAKQPAADRRRWNHPSGVLRHWEAATRSGDKPTTTTSVVSTPNLGALPSEESEGQKPGTGRQDESSIYDGEPDEVARALLNRWSPQKAENVARALLKLLDHDRRSEQARTLSHEGPAGQSALPAESIWPKDQTRMK